MANITNLKPIVKGEHRGRPPGVQNRTTRALKLALIEAAERSDHCPQDDKSLRGYCLHLANKHEAVFAGLLGRLIPVQAKIETNNGSPPRLTADMDLEMMVTNFAMRLKDANYRPAPRVIENDADEDETA